MWHTLRTVIDSAHGAVAGVAGQADYASVPDRCLLDLLDLQGLLPGGEGGARFLGWRPQADDLTDGAERPADGGKVWVGIEDRGEHAHCFTLPAPAVGLGDQRRAYR